MLMPAQRLDSSVQRRGLVAAGISIGDHHDVSHWRSP
jgi:hypothetical protein